MILIKENGFATLECVISLFIVSMIVFVMTSTLHNNSILLRKNSDKREMLYIAKEIIEDERNNIKNNDINEKYSKESNIKNFTVKTLATPTSNYKCYNLNVKVLGKENEIELDTYVTKKK
ncbi:hypothetical protein [Terrisporobacter sp.]